MKAEQWFEELLSADENAPDALTEDLLLDVTEQIYCRMRDRGLRPSDLAARLGVSRAFVSQLLNGKPNMTMRTLVSIAHALDQRVHIVLEGKSEAQREPAASARPARESHPDHDGTPDQERLHHRRRRSARNE
jgi:transcriptional regulator with XRE-family HTH domain